MSTAERRICVSICERDLRALTSALRHAGETGHFIEVRLDCVNEGDQLVDIYRFDRALEGYGQNFSGSGVHNFVMGAA